jgi:phage terminase small subunit
MRGRKPTNLSVLSGSHPAGGQKKHVHVIAPLGAPPEYLTNEAKGIFTAIRDSAPMRFFGAIDSPLIAVLAEHLALHKRVARELAELDGLTITTASTERAHPLVGVATEQAAILVRLAESLSLTPATRARVRVPEAAGDWGDVA